MQLTPYERQLLDQLGGSQVWRGLLDKLAAPREQVLRKNTVIEQLCQAQGYLAAIDELRGLTAANK